MALSSRCAGNSLGHRLPGRQQASAHGISLPCADALGKRKTCVHVQEMSYDTPFARTDTFSPQLEDLMNCCIQCAPASLRT